MALRDDDIDSLNDEPHNTDIFYNPEFEQLLKENGDHAQVYSILHQMSYIKYKHRFDILNIPLIVLTAIIGFVTGIGINYQYIGIILGASSVFVSIMKSIISYMKLSERSENHRICSLQFGQISNEIKIELSLRREQRQPAKILLDVIKVKFKNLLEVAQLLDDDVINRFRTKYLDKTYKDSDVSLPPVFSSIPGIKILGANNEQEHKYQLESNLNKYKADKAFEREQVRCELQHFADLRKIKDEFRVPVERRVQMEVEDYSSDSSSNPKQSRRIRSTINRQRSVRSYPASMVVSSPQPPMPTSDVQVNSTISIPPSPVSESPKESIERTISLPYTD